MSATAKPKMFIIHPWVDVVAIGGLSIAFLTFLLLFEPGWSEGEMANKFIVLSALLNWPHFMATYALMYRSRETVQQYPWASKWMPLALGITCAAGVVAQISVGYTGALQFLAWMAGAYLAWHYTGQTWGMMASFSFMSGDGIQQNERTWIRTGLRIMLTWHLIWFLQIVEVGGVALKQTSTYMAVYLGATYSLIPLGALVSLVGLWKYRQRIGHTPNIRVLVPFFANTIWYIAMAINPFAIFWVQLSHSLQYLLFPTRVEINRGQKNDRSPVQSAVLFLMLALGLGVFAFEVFPRALSAVVAVESLLAVKIAIGVFINIHHFFADGVIWKITNPNVKKELFAHLR